MNRRKASDAGGSVLSFTFLDVLMCTMGSLLLLLVLFGVIVKKSTRVRREGEKVTLSLAALTAPDAPAQAAAPPAPPAADPSDVAAAVEMSQQLAKLRSEQAEIERIRGEAAQRRLEEQGRIAHIEDHERRLEHELAQLHITLEVLQATEQKQTVDQAQAEAEVARLRELISETEGRLDKMRKAGTGQKSFAIVPYKGANGTFRQPVFVECTAGAVTIQPEGIRLTPEDFDGPLRSGNPLAAALRAAHEELNSRAAAAGRTDLPDAYPLMIVRPDGAAAYDAAVDSIRSWDSDYGYEFVEAAWKLKYPEPDPRLAQVMAHAVDEARQRQALLAKVAPREYGPRLGGEEESAEGFGKLATSGASNRIGSHAGEGAFGAGVDPRGNRLRTGNAGGRYGMGGGSGDGNFSDEFAGSGAPGERVAVGSGGPGNGGASPGNGLGDPSAISGLGGPGSASVGGGAAGATGEGNSRDATSGANGRFANDAAGQNGQSGSAGATSGAAGAGEGASATAQTEGSAEGTMAAGGAAGGSGSSSASASGSASSGGSSGGNPGGSSGNAGGMGGIQSVQVGPKSGSIADKRGANWANAEAARRTSAITRPVRVIVRADQMAVISDGGAEADAAVVSFKQPVDKVVDQLAGAVQMQVVDWGLAGDGMYWRPTLVVTVAPGAERQAQRLAELLDNSGLDVRLPQATANASQRERQ